MVSKISVSGQNVIVVPVSWAAAPRTSGPIGSPRSYAWVQTYPSLRTSTSSIIDRAFTTDTPTPCRPPETA